MKKYIKHAISVIKNLSNDRGLFSIYLLMAIIVSINVIYIVLTVRPSELQLVSHYTAFGTTHLYRANWLDQTKTIFISITVLLFHIYFSQMSLEKISRPISKVISWAGVLILVFIFINSSLLINVWSPK